MRTKTKYPKVLVVGQYFSYNNGGGGITLCNLFKGWHKDKLANLPFSMKDTEFTVCTKYYRLGNKEKFCNYPILYSKVKTKSINFEIREDSKSEKENLLSLTSKPKIGILKKIKNYFVDKLGLYNNAYRIIISTQLLKWINDFNPDIIYAQYSTYSTMKFVSELVIELKKPLIVHFMDDWIRTVNTRNYLKKYWDRKINFEFRNLLKLASVRLTISEAMKDEYEKRYGYQFDFFHNPVKLDFWLKHLKKSWDYKAPFNILYSGRIGHSISDVIIEIAEAIEFINKLGYKTVFKIQSTSINHSTINALKEYKNVKINPIAKYDEIPKIYSSADALILPYDFAPSSVKFIKYSMPTKATEYMITGVPIIIYAPAETAVAKFFLKNKCAIVINKQGRDNLAKSIIDLIDNDSLRERIGKTAHKIAKANYSYDIVSDKFRNLLNDAKK